MNPEHKFISRPQGSILGLSHSFDHFLHLIFSFHIRFFYGILIWVSNHESIFGSRVSTSHCFGMFKRCRILDIRVCASISYTLGWSWSRTINRHDHFQLRQYIYHSQSNAYYKYRDGDHMHGRHSVSGWRMPKHGLFDSRQILQRAM